MTVNLVIASGVLYLLVNEQNKNPERGLIDCVWETEVTGRGRGTLKHLTRNVTRVLSLSPSLSLCPSATRVRDDWLLLSFQFLFSGDLLIYSGTVTRLFMFGTSRIQG